MLTASIGYPSGSISFARVIARLVELQSDISLIEVPIPDSDEVFVSDAVSAIAVRMQVGARYGCITGILDMLKVTVRTLVLKCGGPIGLASLLLPFSEW